MSPERIVWLATGIALVVVLVMTGMQGARAMREAKRLGARIDELESMPVVRALERGEKNARRIEAALAQIAPLIARAQLAAAEIKRGPLPPELVGAVRRLRAEITAFRAFAGR